MSFEPSKIREWVDYFAKEGQVIRQAPVTFLIVVTLSGYCIYRYLDSSYKSDYTGRLALKDDQIKLRDDQIKLKDDQEVWSISVEKESGSILLVGESCKFRFS